MQIHNKDILEKNIDEVTFVVLDLETTGLKAKFKDRIIEVGAVKLLNGKVIDKINSFINPLRPLARGAYEINKIDYHVLRNAPLFRHFSKTLLNFIRDSVIVAYNAPFDITFLEKEFNLVDTEIRFYLGKEPIISNFLLTEVQNSEEQLLFHDTNIDSIYVVDVLNLIRTLIPRLTAYRQSFIADLLEVNKKPTHRALEDVFTTMEIFNFIVNILKNFGFNQLKYLVDSNIYEKLSKVKIEQVNSAIEERKEIKIEYLDIQSKNIKQYEILPENINQEKSILEAKEKYVSMQFDLDKILKIEKQ